MPLVAVEVRCVGGAAPAAVTPAAVRDAAMDAGVYLMPMPRAGPWTFGALDFQVQKLLQHGLVVDGEKLTVQLQHAPAAPAFGQPHAAVGQPPAAFGKSPAAFIQQAAFGPGAAAARPDSASGTRIMKVIIAHDAENCPITRSDGQVNPFTLRDKLLLRILSLFEGAAASAPGRLNEVKVEWNFMLKTHNPTNPWHPIMKVYDTLLDMAKVVTCADRPQAVDNKLKTLLKEVEKNYRDTPQEEKDRTLVVLIGGDRDFADDVRGLRESHMGKAGLRVVVVYSTARPPRQCLRDAVGDPRLFLGIWEELVQDSKEFPGAGPTSPGVAMGSVHGGTAARRTNSRPAACHRPGPPTDLVGSFGLKMTIASFLWEQQQRLLPRLREEVSRIHPALVVELHVDHKMRNYGLKLRAVTGGCLRQPAGPHCAEAAGCVESFVASLVEAKLSELRGLRDDEASADAVAAPLPGLSAEELRDHPQLSAIKRHHGVLVFITGLNQAAHRLRKLKDNELFIVAESTSTGSDDEIRNLCWHKYWVRAQVDRSSEPPVLVIEHQGAALAKAKTDLVQSGLFSEQPKVKAQQHEMILFYPSDWTPKKLAAFCHSHGLVYETKEPPRVKPNRTSIKIGCSGATRNLLLRLSSASGSLIQCKDWQTSASSAAAADSAAGCSVILVYQRGNEQGRDAVWSWLLSLTNTTEELPLPEHRFTEHQLLKRNWRSISAVIRELGVQLRWNAKEPRSKVVVSGPMDAVNGALAKMQRLVNSIQLVDVGTAEKPGCQNLVAAVTKLLEDLTTRAAQKASTEEDSDEEGTGDSSSGGQGVSQLRNKLAFNVQRGSKTISLAYFQGDQDLVRSIKEDLDEFLTSYEEKGWELPHPCDQAALSESYKPQWTTSTAQKMGLTSLDWIRSVQGGHSLWLSGPRSNVLDAVSLLRDLFTKGQQTELLVAIDFVTNALLKMKYHKDRRGEILLEAKRAFKTVKIVQSSDRSLRCLGQPGPAQKAKDYLEQLIREFAKEQVQERLDLTWAERDFLQNEGKDLLKDTASRGCFYRLEQKSTARLASARLAGCDLEVWKADAVADFQDVEALVNSANERLQHGGGIAADIARAAGPGLDVECQQILARRGGRLQVAEVVVTGAHGLGEVGYGGILHAVPPKYPADGAELEATVVNILAAASDWKVKSLAVPILGAGIFGWPLEKAVEHIFAALGNWAATKAGQSSLKRIVLMDVAEDRAQAAAERLRQLILGPEPSSSSAPADGPPAEPELHLPQVPAYAWYWNTSTVPFDRTTESLSRGWTCYDYQQVMQLEKAWQENQRLVVLNGDSLGKPSDSTCILEGQKYATYEVNLDEYGPGYDAVQYNQAVNIAYGFKFPRAVRRVKLVSLEDAFKRVGLFQELYEEAQETYKSRCHTYQEKLAAYQQRQASRAFAPSPAAAEPEAPAAKVFLPAGSHLTFFGPKEEVPQVLQQLQEDMRRAYKVSMKPLELGPDMTLEEVWDSLQQHLEHCSLQEVQFEVGDGTVEIRALGEKSLLRAEREIAEWQAQQALEAARVQYPPEWSEISKQDADKPGARYIEVEPGTEEYKVVEQRLRDAQGRTGVTQRNAFKKRLVKVERVQNPLAYRAYHSRRRVLRAMARNKNDANELWVKHGTGTTNPTVICEGEEGLDARYSGWGMLGRGAYTAEDANYSDRHPYCHEFTAPDGRTLRQMILCRVAAGSIAEVEYDANVTGKFIKPPQGFDSVRGDVIPGTGAFALVVYSPDQAYPAYLITYEP